MAYDLGDVVRVSVAFSTVATGVALDPTAVYLSVKDPDGNITLYQYGVDSEIVKDSTGNYHADIDVDTYGQWYYRWYSTGAGKAADEGSFYVDPAEAVP